VAARYEVIDSRVQVAQEAEIEFGVLGVDSLALADAAECCDFLRVGESVALINLGAQTTSIHFIKDGKSNFIRDVSWGARELILAISKARRVEVPEAEQILVQSGMPRAVAPPPLPSLPEEPAPPATKAPAVIKGALDPLDEELGALDDVVPSKTRPTGPSAGPEKSVGEILSVPFGRLVSEVRRSFDYYEQQLYEHAVDRLIVSGGVAHLSLLRETLADELGVGVELADPTNSALMLGPDTNVAHLLDQPAQFMVAVGLAARGMAGL
jgi:type IV pilus assembly protein PilM